IRDGIDGNWIARQGVDLPIERRDDHTAEHGSNNQQQDHQFVGQAEVDQFVDGRFLGHGFMAFGRFRRLRRVLVFRGWGAKADDRPATGKCCGGLLAPDAQEMLSKFGLALPKSILVDPQLFIVRTIDLHLKLERNYQRFYMNMDRAKFDEWLVKLS
ncbi:hypothetical protein BVY04_03690, partial [bacterium M21]